MKHICIIILALAVITGCQVKSDPAIEPAEIIIGKTFGGAENEGASRILRIEDSALYLSGNGTQSGVATVFLQKLDLHFNSEWNRSYESAGVAGQYTYHMATLNNGIILSGTSIHEGNEDLLLIKCDLNGSPQWEKRLGGVAREEGHTIIELSDRSLIVTGLTASKGQGGRDVYLVKLDESGRMIWDKTFGSVGDDYAHDLAITIDQHLLLIGTSDRQIYVIKLDLSGNLIWERTYAFGQDNSGWTVIDGHQGYLMGCYVDGDVSIAKIDPEGELLWETRIGGNRDDYVLFGKAAQNGSGYIFCGQTQSYGNGGSDAYLVKIDEQGNLLWEKTIGAAGNDGASAFVELDNGALVVAGSTDSYGNGGQDVWLFKLSSAGDLLTE